MNIIYNWEQNKVCECLTQQNEKCLRRSSYNINGKNYCNQHSKPIIGNLYSENETKKTNKFIKPTLEEIEQYCKERNNNVDAKLFYDYYSVNNWKDSDGKEVKNWKQKLITWERKNNNNRKSASRDRIEAVYDRFLNEKEE